MLIFIAWLVFCISILANIYFLYRLILLPCLAEICFDDKASDFTINILEKIISRHDRELELILDEVMERAELKGFKLVRPEVRVLKKWLRLLRTDKILARAMAIGLWNRILFDGKCFNSYTKKDLVILMAHEVGHIIDNQTQRRGHPLFDKIRDLNNEYFANSFAAFLYSKKEVIDTIGDPPQRQPYKFDSEFFNGLDLYVMRVDYDRYAQAKVGSV